MPPPLLIDTSGDVLSLVLNKPEQGNALSPDLVEDLISALGETGQARLCTITGAGKHFCTGFYLNDLDALSDGDLLWRILRIEHMLQLVHHAPVPVLCLAQGHAVGAGADLFAAATFRVADPGARLRMPGWNFGLALGTRRLTALIGADAARDMLLDSRSVDAPGALSSGLASQVAPRDNWQEVVEHMSRRAAALPRDATAGMLSLTSQDTRSADMAAIVQTAGQPGLKQRIKTFRDNAMAASQRKNSA